MKVIVLGAGIIGVTSAYFLAREGHEVVVLDRASSAASMCSKANGGQLSYSHVETWAQSISGAKILKLLLKPNSFLSFSDFTNKRFYSWFYQFYQNSSLFKSHENSKNIYAISSYSKKALHQIIADEGSIDFHYKKDGILHFYRTQKSLQKAIADLEEHKKLGIKFEILDAKECVKKEPTLFKLNEAQKLAGGIFYPEDESGDCALFTKALEKICREKYKVKFEYNVEVKNILTNHKKITGINTNKEVFAGDAYVYALGAVGVPLLYGIKIDPKIYPIKGYSLSSDCGGEFMAPKLAMTDVENKIVYSRIGNIFRGAGSVEICGLQNKENSKHVSFLKNAVTSSFSDFGDMIRASSWFGFRPFRPNSTPLICEVKKYGNLFLNSGHGSLGWTLSCGSAKILSEIIAKGDMLKNNPNFAFLKKEEEKIYIK